MMKHLPILVLAAIALGLSVNDAATGGKIQLSSTLLR